MTGIQKRDPLLLAIVALLLYGTLFPLFGKYVPLLSRIPGLPQIYFMLVTLVIVRVCRLSWEEVGCKRRGWWVDLLLGVLLWSVPVAVVFGLWSLHHQGTMPAIRFGAFFAKWWQQIVILGLLAPISEEFFFRGLLTGTLIRSRQGQAVGARFLVGTTLLVSLLFTFAHFRLSIGPFLLSIVTTSLFFWRRSLWGCITLHALCNLLGPALVQYAPRVYQDLRAFFL